MKISFNRENIAPGLPGIVLLSHGSLAEGMLDTIAVVLGETRNLAALSLEAGDDPEVYREALTAAINAFPAGCAVFVDMFGGTPCNQLFLASLDIVSEFCAFSGMNLPMISEAVSSRETLGIDGLGAAVCEIIPHAVMNLKDKLAEFAED